MKKNSLNRKSIDWINFKLKVKQQSEGNETTDDSYKTITYSLTLLGDNHSFLVSQERLKQFFDAKVELPLIADRLVDGKIAYIEIPAFIGNDSLSLLFAGKIQQLIQKYVIRNVSGWIIDLRNNHGGNMWPMFLGLAPLLGPGIHGYFVDADGKFLPWSYTSGAVYEGKNEMQRIETVFSVNNKKNIAVLIGKNTASSGEAIALCFKELTHVRFFGENTFGLTSSNRRFVLPDKAELYLTVSRFCDRKKRVYYSSIEPDQILIDYEKMVEAAATWLNQNP